MRRSLQKLYGFLFHESIAHTVGRLHVVAWIGVALYPAYYFVWAWLIPLPYESMPLRLLGAALCAPLFFERWLRARPALLGAYWLVSMTYCLPFFFVYMTLMNEFHLFWALSTHSSVVILFLFFPNFRASLFVTSIGVAAALLVYYTQFGVLPSVDPYPAASELSQFQFFAGLISVFVFVATASNLLNFHRRSIERSSLDAIQRWSAAILHQNLTPMKSLMSATEGILLHVKDPELQRVGQSALASGQGAIDTARQMMAFELPYDPARPSRRFPAGAAIRSAVDRYPYGVLGSFESRDLVTVVPGAAFDIVAPPDLFEHALQNLINNAMHAINASGRGRIEIRAKSGRRTNLILIRDTAAGIPLQDLPYIFNGFFSRRPGGFGIGLAYCRDFMVGVGGSIECESKTGDGSFTEFRLEFPRK